MFRFSGLLSLCKQFQLLKVRGVVDEGVTSSLCVEGVLGIHKEKG